MRRIPALTAAFVLSLVTGLALTLAAPAPARAAWVWPVTGEVVTPYRNGTDPYAADQHRGIDIAAPVGTAVRAAAAGDVRFAGIAGSSGLTIGIRTADGYDTSYLHLSSVAVRAGMHVSAGAHIGAVGTTGMRSAAAPHLHFGVRDAGTRHAYHDPLDFLPPPPAANPKPVPPSPAPAPAPEAAPPLTAPLAVGELMPAPRSGPRPVPAPRPRGAPQLTPHPYASPRSVPLHRPAPRGHQAPGSAPRSIAPGRRPHPFDAPEGVPDALERSERASQRSPAATAEQRHAATAHRSRDAELYPSPARPNARSKRPAGSSGLDPARAGRRSPTPSAAAAARRGGEGATRANEQRTGPHIGWVAACAGLLIAAALLGLCEDGRRTTKRTRTRLVAALRPLARGR